jgi:hypothetical protein
MPSQIKAQRLKQANKLKKGHKKLEKQAILTLKVIAI